MEVVLVHPQIPQNTGSIARTCAAMQIPLHIVYPIGFEISEKRVRRAGLDYWPHVNLKIHDSWDDFKSGFQGNLWMFSRHATIPYHTASFNRGDALIFGSETSGIPATILSEVPAAQQLCIPMKCNGVRSLNLSNAVSIGLFESLRQCELL